MLRHLMVFCVQENLEPLIEYVAESFWDQLVKFERLQSIQAFKLKYLLMSIKSDVPEKASNLFAPYFATYLLLILLVCNDNFCRPEVVY